VAFVYSGLKIYFYLFLAAATTPANQGAPGEGTQGILTSDYGKIRPRGSSSRYYLSRGNQYFSGSRTSKKPMSLQKNTTGQRFQIIYFCMTKKTGPFVGVLKGKN